MQTAHHRGSAGEDRRRDASRAKFNPSERSVTTEPANGCDSHSIPDRTRCGSDAVPIPRLLDRCVLRWVTAAYLVYLVVPIALLLVGSFGELWLNTLLPTGSTTQWYADVATDPSFRRAFAASLAVVAITCTACAGDRACRSPTRVFHTESRAPACARARALSIAGRAAAAGAGLRLHPRVLVGHAAVARQHLAARRRPRRPHPAVLPAGGSGRHAASGPARRSRTPRSRWAATAGSGSCTSCCRRCAIRSSPA